jgi:hypothetical protein
LSSYLANQLSCISLCTIIHFCKFRGVDFACYSITFCIVVQTFQTATHQVLYCNEEINLMFLFIACSFFILLPISQSIHTCTFCILLLSFIVYSTCSFFCLSVIIYIPLFVPLFFSHLHSLFLLLIISHYLHVPLYFCLSVIYIPCLFCLLVVVYMFLFNILFISYLHAPFCSSVFQSSTFPVYFSVY